MPKKIKLLLIDDDVELCELLNEYLTQEDFEVTLVHDGKEGLESARKKEHDIIVLDVMLPSMNGFEVLKHIQKETKTPVLMLTAKGDEVDRVVGLEIGADDYLPKPCSPRELVARLRAILRRMQIPDQKDLKELAIGAVKINLNTREVSVNSTSIELTNSEYCILLLLMRNAGKVLDKEKISEDALGKELTPFDRSLDMHVSNLRSKIGDLNSGEYYIKTIRGVGYLFEKLDA
ncbi:MAG: response regulator [Gammaproteobacteria bacterium]